MSAGMKICLIRIYEDIKENWYGHACSEVSYLSALLQQKPTAHKFDPPEMDAATMTYNISFVSGM